MNKQMLNKMEQIKIAINNKIDELEKEIDILKNDKTYYESQRKKLELKIKYAEKEYIKNADTQEKREFFAKRILKYLHKNGLYGQFIYKNQWCIYNGHILVLTDKKIDGIETISGLPEYEVANILNGNYEPVDIKISYILYDNFVKIRETRPSLETTTVLFFHYIVAINEILELNDKAQISIDKQKLRIRQGDNQAIILFTL